MQRMRLDSDTTAEPVKSQSPNKVSCNIQLTTNGLLTWCKSFQSSSNISIMDQLNRGVKVEGLMLPPGITLTRVDPNSAEGMRAKKEAISRVSSKFWNFTIRTIAIWNAHLNDIFRYRNQHQCSINSR